MCLARKRFARRLLNRREEDLLFSTKKFRSVRVRAVFKLLNKGAVLPFHHQELIRSLFEMVMGRDFVLDEIDFNYSGLKGQTRVGKDGLHYFSKRVTLVISSTNVEFIDAIIKNLFNLNYFYLGNLQLVPE